jgi:hypothetical protein
MYVILNMYILYYWLPLLGNGTGTGNPCGLRVGRMTGALKLWTTSRRQASRTMKTTTTRAGMGRCSHPRRMYVFFFKKKSTLHLLTTVPTLAMPTTSIDPEHELEGCQRTQRRRRWTTRKIEMGMHTTATTTTQRRPPWWAGEGR